MAPRALSAPALAQSKANAAKPAAEAKGQGQGQGQGQGWSGKFKFRNPATEALQRRIVCTERVDDTFAGTGVFLD